LIKWLLRNFISANGASISNQKLSNQRRRAVKPCLIECKVPSASSHQGPMAFLGGSLNVTRSIDSRKRMDGRKSGGRSWRQAPAPVRQLFWWVRRAMLWPKRRAVSFGYDLKSYSQNFDDGLVPAHRL
uniref:Uncharacterized protein n=1 Tax=Aegilops tauschii subsp. strangulata TaxID=200361 RepID=A0A452YCY7_AEGTS